MNEVYAVESLRTPLGSFGGALADVEAPRLAATVIRGLLERTGLAAEAIDEVIVGQVLAGGTGQAPARQTLRYAGLPDAIPALTINKVCGSGLKALMLGAGSIRLGDADLVLAGGMENMSLAPFALSKGRYGYRMGSGELLDLMVHDGLQDPYSGKHMGEIAEASAEKYGLTRAEQDAFALASYRKAQAALKEGTFREEIVPVVKKGRQGEVTLAEDEEPLKVDFDKLPGLRADFRKDSTITAGNASTINDGAGMTLLASAGALKRHGLTPKARLVAYASNSIHPDQFTEAPVGAIQVLARLTDNSEFMEYRPDYGREVFTGIAKVDGFPVAFIGNRQGVFPGYPEYAKGAYPGVGGKHYREGLIKQGEFVTLCGRDNLPIVWLQDTTGIDVGDLAEEAELLALGQSLIYSIEQTELAMMCVVLRKGTAAAHYIMCGPQSNNNNAFTLGTPLTEIYVMHGETAAAASYARRLVKEEEAGRDLAPILDKMNQMIHDYQDKSRPAYCAKSGFVDEIVPLTDLRKYIQAFTGANYQNPRSITPVHQLLLPRIIRGQGPGRTQGPGRSRPGPFFQGSRRPLPSPFTKRGTASYRQPE